jgi:hypothetical protein
MQQINLYLPEFRPNREPLRSVHMLWAAVGIIVLLVLFSLYSTYRNSQLRHQVAAEQNAVQEAQAQLLKLSAQQPQNMRAQLEVEIQQLQSGRDRRQQILAVISSQNLGNDTGFSAQLQTLARQSLDTLALEKFSLQQGGNYVELSGTTRTADQVPLYLQRLRSEQSFAPVRFGVMRIERGENSAAPLVFQLAKAEDDKKSAAGNSVGGAR